jgi:hypothetical protein
MSNKRDRLGDSWENLVPEQPPQRDRLPIILAAASIGVVIICLLIAIVYVVYQEFQPGIEEAILPPIPTQTADIDPPAEVSTEPTSTSVVEELPLPASSTDVPIAATTDPTATMEDKETETIASTEADIEIMSLPSPPVIDGLLNEWAGVTATSSAYIVHQVSDWDGSDDLVAHWQLSWDMTNLYVAVGVADDTHVQNQTGNQIFRGDSVDMQIDVDRQGDFSPVLSPDDFQLTMSPGNFFDLPPSAFLFQGTDSGQIVDSPGEHQLVLAVQRQEDGYSLEAAIPWSNFNLTPAPGMTIGLALNASDNDTPGTAVQEIMKSHVPTRTLTDPTGWGTLTLR